jgi:hypothetical protein
MSASSVLRALAGEVVEFVVFVGELLGGAGAGAAREAILRDLGAQPGAGNLVLPEAPMASIKAYRDAVDTDLQADIAAAGDIAVVLGAIIDQIEAWGGSDWSGRTDTFVTSLFDLLGRTYVRRRLPRRPVLQLVRHHPVVRLEPGTHPRRPGRHPGRGVRLQPEHRSRQELSLRRRVDPRHHRRDRRDRPDQGRVRRERAQ